MGTSPYVISGSPVSADSVEALPRTRSSAYDELVATLQKLPVGKALNLAPPDKSDLADRKKHRAFRSRIAAVCRRASERSDGRIAFLTTLIVSGVAVTAIEGTGAPAKKAAPKKASKKAKK